MNEVLKQIISAGDNVKLLVRRPALVTLLRHEVLLRRRVRHDDAHRHVAAPLVDVDAEGAALLISRDLHLQPPISLDLVVVDLRLELVVVLDARPHFA